MFMFELPSGRMWREFNFPFLGLTLALVVLGIINLLGATWQVPTLRDEAIRQIKWVGLGLTVMGATLFIKREFLIKSAPFFYVVVTGLLVYVFTFPSSKGAHSWVRFGGIGFQPSEPAKIVLVLMAARVLAYYTPLTGKKLAPGLFWVTILFAIPMALIAKQPDLGTAAICISPIFPMFYAARAQRSLLICIILWAIVGGMVVYPHLKDYQKRRIETFLYPEQSSPDARRQIEQSKITQGSGRIWGKGFGKGTQTELRFLSEFWTDSIYSCVGEQFGFVGSVIVLAFFMMLIARAYYLACWTRELFDAYAIVGLASILAAHVVFNMWMNLGMAPVMGLPLPFFSYGGSFMLNCLLMIGLILNLRMRRHMF